MRSSTFPSARVAPSATVLRVFGARPFHTDGEVLALAFASDGGLWSVEEPGVLRRWHPAGRRQTAWHALDDPAPLWAFGPGADLAVSAGDELTLWEVPRGKCLGAWPSPSWVTAVAFAPDGTFLATGHDDAAVRVWDVRRGEVLRVLEGHGRAVSALAFSPDGSRLASAGEERAIHVWDAATGKRVGSLTGHTDRVPALAWHPDGTRLVSAGWDTTARVWDVATFEPVILLNAHSGQVEALAFSPDGARLACADSDCTVRVWDFASRRTLAVLAAGSGEVRCLAYGPDGSQLTGGGSERVIHLWDAGGDSAETEPADAMASRAGVAVSPDGARVTGLGPGTPLRVWEMATGRVVLSLADPGPLRAFAASPDGRWYAGSRDVGDRTEQWNARVRPGSREPRRTVGLWDALTGARVATLDGQRAPVTALAFAPDSRTLATGGFLSSDVWLWRVPSGEPELLLPGVAEGSAVEALAFQPRGRLLAIGAVDWMQTGSSDGQVFLWDLAARAVLRTLPGGATCLAFHPGGRRLAAGTPAESIHLVEVSSGDIETELIGHEGAVTCVAFSPGGRWVASASDDRTVRLWDGESGLEKGVAECDTQVKALAFTPDGRRLVTANASTSCYLLDVGQFLQQ
jgi:WD40 repeat protein